jgi:long-chain acyl-CoA synthetase
VAENFAPVAARKPDAAALVDETRTVTWQEFNAHVNQLIHAWRSAGLAAGDTIAVLGDNRVEFFEALGAAMHAGLIVVPLNWHWVPDEIAYVLDDADVRALLVDEDFADVGLEAVGRLDRALLTIRIGGDEYAELLAAHSADEPADQVLAGPMFYTSGTTGRPKGVRNALTRAGMPASVWQLVAAGAVENLGLPTDGVTLLCGPAYHSAQWAFAMLPLLTGSTLVMRAHFDPVETLELIDRYQVTNLHLVPTQLTRLLHVPESARTGFSGASLRVVYHGAAPCPPDVKRAMIEWWGPTLVEYYGGTEGAMLSTITSADWLEHPSSVGRPWDSVEVLVVRDDGTPCETGEAGILYVRSRLGMDFEYHGDPAKTEAAHNGPGVFTLGDIGYLDEQGWLHLSDRRIDLIISGGVNVYPAEIEGVLATHPAVRDVAVFGIPNDEFGEEVKAAVELEPGHDASPALASELLDHCRANLAGYKVPRSIDFETALPRHPTGKLYKRVLRDAYWQDTGRRI